jgi:G3E family GTPase
LKVSVLQIENEVDSLAQEAEAKEHAHDDEHSHDHDHDHNHDHAHAHGEEEHCDECGHSHAPGEHDHDHVHHKNIHDDSVSSASFVIKGEMDLQKLNMWLGALLEHRGDDIYRMKGILNIKFNKERFVFQVHLLYPSQ